MIRARFLMASAATVALMCSAAGIAAAAEAPGAAPIVIAQAGGEGPKGGGGGGGAAARSGGGGGGAAARSGSGGGGGGRAISSEGRRSTGGENRAPRVRDGGGDGARNVVRESRRVRSPDRANVERRVDRGNDGVRNRTDRQVRNRGGEGRPWRSGRRYSWGPGIYFYLYDGYYYGDCSWLRAKARSTGSSYWWQRYRQCREAW